MLPRLLALLRSAFVSPKRGAAASQVFDLPELVAIIVQGFSQAELCRAARVSRAAAAECQRLLMVTPTINNLDSSGLRLQRLADAVQRRPGQVERLSIACRPRAVPDRQALRLLLRRCSNLTSLEFAGLNCVGLYNLRTALDPIAPQLTNLTLTFMHFGQPQPAGFVGLLAACTGLRHLRLVGLPLDSNFGDHCPPPTYSLTSFAYHNSIWYLDQDSLAWLLGNSAATLRALASDAFLPRGLRALPRLAPHLEHALFGLDPDEREDLRDVVRVAEQASARCVVLEVDNGRWHLSRGALAEVRAEVAQAVAGLDRDSRTKVTVRIIEWVPGKDEWLPHGMGRGEYVVGSIPGF